MGLRADMAGSVSYAFTGKQDQIHGTNRLRGIRDFRFDGELTSVMHNPEAAVLHGSQVVTPGNESHVMARPGQHPPKVTANPSGPHHRNIHAFPS